MTENKKVVLKAYDFLLSKDLDALTDLLADDFKYVGASTKEFDVEGFRRITLRDFNVFPDTKIDFETIVVEYVISGTHKGKLGSAGHE